MLRVAYMGTPEIAATVLRAVCEMPVEIVGVWTQPDRPVGRKQIMTKPPVKIVAEEKGIPVYQPLRVKRKAAVQELVEAAPDLIFVTAYGQILSEEILQIPRLGCINLHTSLLPKYRGAAPIQWAIVNGETVTGVTAMQMDVGMDTGDILVQRQVAIDAEETAGSLTDKLAAEGADLAKEVLQRLIDGETLPRQKQEEAQATYAPIIQKEDGCIDWNKSARQIEQQIRGFLEWPGAYTQLEERKIIVLKAKVLAEAEAKQWSSEESLPVGSVLEAGLAGKHPQLLIQTGEGILQILTLQVQGKKEMQAEAFLRGNSLLHKQFG